MVQGVCIYVKYTQWTMCKMCKKRLLILCLVANVADFALFAGALCERRRTCVTRCTYWSSLDKLLVCWSWVQIQQISRNSRELWWTAQIWLIRSNFLGFSLDGQRSETSELNMDEVLVRNAWNSRNSRDMWANWANFAWFAGILGSSLPLIRHLPGQVPET